eukprot:1932546-Pleurochrysis_carterae.AAC.1
MITRLEGAIRAGGRRREQLPGRHACFFDSELWQPACCQRAERVEARCTMLGVIHGRTAPQSAESNGPCATCARYVDSWRFSTIMIEPRGAKQRKLARATDSYTPLQASFVLSNYVDRKRDLQSAVCRARIR